MTLPPMGFPTASGPWGSSSPPESPSGYRSAQVYTTLQYTYNVHGGTIPETVDLDVVRGLDEVSGGDGSIGNESDRQRSSQSSSVMIDKATIGSLVLS